MRIGSMLRFIPSGVKSWLLRHRRLRASARTVLGLLVPSGPRLVTVQDGPAVGQKIFTDVRIAKGYWLGTYEADLIDFVRPYVRTGMTIYDIGGHEGYFSLIFASLVGPGGRVLTIEPVPTNSLAISRMIHANALEGRITLLEAAACDKSGQVSILTSIVSSAQGKLAALGPKDVPTPSQDSLLVDAVRLDDISREFGSPDLVKIDVEGAEGIVIDGMTNILHSAQPNLVIEIHGEHAGQQVWERLAARRYSIWHIEDAKEVSKASDMIGGHVFAYAPSDKYVR
jgi:FkbM family methyltransferase